jgi:hypothetical protein
MTFDGEPTADSELHYKLDHTIREELEGLVSAMLCGTCVGDLTNCICVFSLYLVLCEKILGNILFDSLCSGNLEDI